MSAVTAEAELEAATGSLDNPEDKNHAAGLEEAAVKTPPPTTASIEESLKQLLEPETPPIPGEEPQPGAEPTPEEKAAAEAEELKHQWPESAQRRVDKLTAQKAERDDKIATLEREKNGLADQVAELETKLDGAAPVIAATPDNPLGFIKTAEELSSYVGALKTNLRAIEDHFDGALEGPQLERFTAWAKANGAVDDNGEFNPGRLKQFKRLAQDALSDHAPRRLDYIRAEAEQSASADKAFPWLADRKSEEYKQFQSVLKTLPEVKRLPHWKGVAAIFVRGLMVVNAEKAAASAAANAPNGAKRPAPKPSVSRLPGTPAVVPQRTPAGGDVKLAELRARALKTRDPRDYERLVAAQLAA